MRRLRAAGLVGLALVTAVTATSGATIWLGVPVRTQEHSQWCWAGSSQSMLEYYRVTVAQCELANYAFGRSDCCGVSAFDWSHPCNQPNFIYGSAGSVQGILQHWGVASNGLYSSLSQPAVTAQIDSGRPFIMRFGWTSGGGHMLVTYGYEQDATYLNYMDPWPGNGYTKALYAWVVSGTDHTWTHTLQMASAPALTRVVSLRGDLAFGHVTVGATATRPLTISNTGNAVLTVTGIAYPLGFSGAWSGTVPPGGSQTVNVTFAPTALTSYGGTVTVNANQTSGTNMIVASGSGSGVMDFNRDGISDLAWRNRVAGDIRFWLMNAGGVSSETTISGPEDRRWRIVAMADVNADGSPDLVMRHATSGENQVWLMNGTSHTGTLALPTVADTRWQIAAATDFNADGRPDLLWRNAGNGDVVVWYLNGGAYVGWSQVASIPDPTWVMAGVADFNGGGRPDIVWHNATTGENLLWYMIGPAYAGWAALPTEADTSWVIAGVADYNGDGKPDLVWRNNATGENRLWRMNNATLLGTDALPWISDTDYEGICAEAGRTRVALNDFNVDGHPDILWHNDTTGESRVWYMAGTDGATRLSDVSIGIETDLAWKIVAVADFNGNGLPDIVWRNASTGQNKIWLMQGRVKIGEMALPTIADANWHIVGVGDFNQDGHPDLAWRNYVTGDNIIWFLQNGEYAGWTAPPTITDTDWKIVAVGDFNGDRWPDLFWRNTATGQNIAWFLVRGVYAGWGAPPTIPDPTWQIVGAADYNDDGKADLLWRNATTGENLLWYLQDGAYVGWAALPALGVAWKTGVGQ